MYGLNGKEATSRRRQQPGDAFSVQVLADKDADGDMVDRSVEPFSAEMSAPSSTSASSFTDWKESRAPWYKWYVLGLLVLLYALSSVDKTVISIVAEPLKHEMRLSDAQLGFLSGTAFSLTFAVFALPVGFLLDRMDRPRLTAAMLALWSGLTTLCALAKTYGGLLLARLGVGAGETAAVPGSLAILADVFPRRRHSTAVSIFYAGASVGTFLGYIGGGYLLAHDGWRSVFLMAGLPGLLIAVLLALTVRTGRPLPKGQARVRTRVADLLNPSLLLAILGNTFATGGCLSVTLWSTSFMPRIFDLTPAAAATQSGLAFGIGPVIGAALAGPWADRWSGGKVSRLAAFPVWGSVAGALGAILMGVSPSVPIALLGMWTLAFASGFFLGNGFSLVLGLSDRENCGTIVAGTKLITVLGGTGLIPLMTGIISDATHSMRWAIALTGATMFVAAAFFLLTGLSARRRERLG